MSSESIFSETSELLDNLELLDIDENMFSEQNMAVGYIVAAKKNLLSGYNVFIRYRSKPDTDPQSLFFYNLSINDIQTLYNMIKN